MKLIENLGRSSWHSASATTALVAGMALVLASCAAPAAPTAAPPQATGTPQATATPAPTMAEPDAVTLRLDFTINGKHAPFVLGVANGFYSEAGIDLSIQEGRGSLASVQLVASKDDLVALADATAMVTAAAGGAPVRMVVCFSQQTPTAAISFGELNTPEDLTGKIIGYSTVGSTPLAWEAFKARNNLSSTDFTEVTLDGPALLPALIDGRIDVDLGLVNAEGSAAPVLSGQPVNMLRFADWQTNALAHGLVFHNDTIRDDPDLVRRFVEASVRSWQYAVENPAEAVDALMDEYPESNREIIENQLDLSFGLMFTPNTEGMALGLMAEEDWQDTVELLTDYGQLESDLAVSDYYTNEFVPNQ